MKRSRINEIMSQADDMIRSFGFSLPPFAYWSPSEFQARKSAASALIDARCGWDITDYGAGDFDQMGLFLFTLRNGRLADLQRGRGMCYAEKLLVSRQDQLSPMHTHIEKAEDIIKIGLLDERLVGVGDGLLLWTGKSYRQRHSRQSQQRKHPETNAKDKRTNMLEHNYAFNCTHQRRNRE